MTEAFILDFIPQKLKQLGYQNYHLRYKDMTIQGRSSLNIAASSDLYFVVDEPQGLVIESDYGIYDSTGAYIADNSHLHKGEIKISNPDVDNRRIKFIQVILVS